MFDQLRNKFLSRRALNAYTAGDYQTALTLFKELRDKSPSQAGHGHNIALCYLGMGAFEQAEPLLLQELEQFGDHFPRIRALGDLYYAWGKREKAEEYYRRAIEESPEEEGVRQLKLRIEICRSEERFARAQEAAARYQEGNELLAAEKPDEALDAFADALALDPSNVQAMNNYATMLMNHKKDVDQAVSYFEKALALHNIPAIRLNMQRAAEFQAEQEKKRRKGRS